MNEGDDSTELKTLNESFLIFKCSRYMKYLSILNIKYIEMNTYKAISLRLSNTSLNSILIISKNINRYLKQMLINIDLYFMISIIIS